ncbi:hypothetical protein [Streptomyces sp. NBC_00887]|uniref:hypothetical protein n=1 Tax=Streptomyces sp. NBC_00887 TaxID=2975859 RepID=UPI00386CF783|nr:hypothetical protein OG844_26050 [Streptomyces sp. NBC_00887]
MRAAPPGSHPIKRVNQHATALRRLMTDLSAPELSQLVIRLTADVQGEACETTVVNYSALPP